MKGRSGPAVAADFSANEFDKIKDFERGRFDDGIYRICIVTSALQKNRQTHHFDYVRPVKKKGKGYWYDPRGRIRLDRKPLEAARFYRV